VVWDKDQRLVLHLKKFDYFNERFPHHQSFYLSTGLFCFKDSLLPDVVVSRSTVKNFNEEIVANIMYATRQLLEFNEIDHSYFSYFPDLDSSRFYSRNYTIGLFDRIKIYERDPDFWNSLPCAYTKEGLASINDLRKIALHGRAEFTAINFESEFYKSFSRYLLQKNFNIICIINGKDYHLEGIARNVAEDLPEIFHLFRPLKFVSCNDKSKVAATASSFNINHRLIQWLLGNATLIDKEYHFLGVQLLREILNSSEPVKERIKAINDILNRFRIILPLALRPADNLNLAEDDFQSEK
jgi:hypothetical protein